MAEENNGMVNLGDLGSVSASDVRKALEGQPSPVQSGDDETNETPQTPAPKAADNSNSGAFAGNLMQNEDGTFKYVNPYDSNLDFDLDQFETKRRRVSEGSNLSGILNGVEGLEQNFVYTGLEDTARRSEEAQGVVNKMKNGMTQFVADTGINVAQGFAALLYGVPSAIVNGDITKLYDNAVANGMDKGTEFLDEFYKIKRGGDQSAAQKTANFLFDDLAGAASFVTGAIATEMAFTGLTALTFGGAAPAQAAVTAGIVARGTRLLHKALNGGKALVSGTLVDDALRGARALKANATREAASAALRNAAAQARNPMALQAAARVGRQLITGASMESGMEARHMLNAAVENQKQAHESLYGEGSFTDVMAEGFREQISGYGDAVFGANMALVGASNMLMFPKLFGVGLRRGMQTSKFIDTTKLSSRARARLAKNLGVPEGKLPRMVDAARGNTMGRIVGRTGEIGRVTARNTKNALYEGFIEEGGQGAISRSAEDYIAKKYDPRGVDDTLRYVDSFLEGLKGSYTTQDGFKEIGLGMLLAFTGVPMYARSQKADGAKWEWQMMGGYADQRRALLAQDRKMNSIIDLSEKHGDVGGILRQEVANMNRQNVLQKEQDIAVNEGRFKDAKDIEAEQIFSHATSKVVTGRYEQSIMEAEQIMEEMSDEELREQLGPTAKNMTSQELQAHKTKTLEAYKARMNRVREAYDQAGQVYRGEDPDIHAGVAHMLYMAKDKDAREKRIAEEMASVIEDMNEGQILDLVRATTELEMTDAQLGQILERINRNKDIDKQLATKKERGIIKNIDEAKQEARNKEVEELTKEQQENLQFIEEMIDTMATANNVDRNKYNFDEAYLTDLARLHYHIARTNDKVSYQEKDIETLYQDLAAVAADRFDLIAQYNDFISPGGVARFEQRMVGALERLAKMSPEERLEQRQEEAAAEFVEEERAEEAQEKENNIRRRSGQSQDVPGSNNMPPSDTGAGSFAPPAQADNVDADAQFGFPEPVGPQVPNMVGMPENVGFAEDTPTNMPGNVGLGGTQQAEAEPTVEATQEPPRSEIGQIRFNSVNAKMSGSNGTIVPDNKRAGLTKLLAGMPIGTKLQLVEVSNGIEVRTLDGVTVAFMQPEKLPLGALNLLRAKNAPLDIVTTTPLDPALGLEGGFGRTGGEIVAINDAGALRIINPAVNRRVSEVLPNGIKDIDGYGVVKRSGDISSMPGLPALTRDVPSDDRYVGNIYISTTDSNGVSAYHAVQLDSFGEYRADMLMMVIDAYNQYVVNPMEAMALGEQYDVFMDFVNVAGIDLNASPKEIRKEMIRALRRTIPSDLASVQKDKVQSLVKRNAPNSRPYFAVEPISKDSYGITLVTYSKLGQKIDRQFSHDKDGNMLLNNVTNALAGHRMNMAKDVDGIVLPNLDLGFERMTLPKMIEQFGKFSNRMPLVFEGKQYNQLPSTVGFAVAEKTPVPIQDLRRPEEPQQTPTPNKDLAVDFTTLDGVDLSALQGFDGTDVSFLIDENATDPMERAGNLYDIPGLTSRQLRDGLNFGAGTIARAFITHTKTVKRNVPIKAAYLRRHVKAQLELQLAYLQSLPSSPAQKAMLEAHEAYLKPENFDRLVDMSLVEVMGQAAGIINMAGKGTLAEALEKLSANPVQSVTDENEEMDAERSENPMAAFDDNFAFGIDPKATLRLEAKMLMMSLQDKTTNSAQSIGVAGRRFLNVNSLMSKLNAALAGVDPSYEAVEARLKEYVGTYPEFQAVLDALTDTAALESLPESVRNNEDIQVDALAVQDMIRNQFVNYAVKEATTFDSVKIIRQVLGAFDNPLDEGVPADIQIWNSDSRNMREHVASDMRGILQQQGFFDINGSIVLDKFKGLSKQLRDISLQPQADQAQALVNILRDELGIVVPVTAVTKKNKTVDGRNRQIFKNIETALANANSGAGGFGRFKKAIEKIGEDKLSIEQLLSDRDAGRNMIDFFVALSDYRENFIQNSSKDGDNKTRWHYSAPKLLHQMLREIQANPANTLLGGRFALLLPEDQGRIKLTYLSGIKLETGNERDFHQMEKGDLAVAQLAFYGNKNEYVYEDLGADKVLISKFLMPTLADKKTMPILQAPAMNAKHAGIVMNLEVANKQWKDIRFRDVVPNVEGAYTASVKRSMDKEIDRIVRLRAGDYEGMTDAQRKAVGFVFMPNLNTMAEEYVAGKMDISPKEFRAAVHARAVKVFETRMDKDIQALLYDTQDIVWEESTEKDKKGRIGKLHHFNAGKKTYQFVKEHVAPEADMNVGGMDKAAFIAFLAKYSMDSLNARTGIVMDTVGDVGAFVKTKNGKVQPKKTATNLGKRFASLIAPGNAIPYVEYRNAKGQLVDNHSVNFLVMPANEVKKADHYEFLKRTLGQDAMELSMQEGYDAADAAEYVTVEEHLGILYAEGKITRKEMSGLLKAIYVENRKLDSAELAWFQPMKPVTTARVGDHMLYVKSAAFPLVPQLTQGMEIDKLREFMEKNKIQRAAYDSAVKLGNEWAALDDDTALENQKMIPVHQDRKVVIDETGLSQRVIKGVDRKYMRIQQQVPVSKAKEKVHGSQVAKLLLVDLGDATFTYEGKSIKGTELHKKYIDAREAEIAARTEVFAEKYGLSIVDKRIYHTPESRLAFANRLYEEGVSRNYDVNELAHLFYDKDGQKFLTPIEAGPSQERLENLIKSVIFKEVYEPMIEGFSGPIRPEVGMTTLDDPKVDKGAIMWIKRGGKRVFNGKLRVAQAGKPDQIIMPWKYKAILTDKNYLDDDGNIDAEKLPEELLRVFAYRIPGQRKSSSAAFEVVGFLPEEYGDTLIVNEELVGRIGQDYDIDKMFGFLYAIKQDEKGKISIVREGDTAKNRVSVARNKQVDIYYASMTSTDINVQKAIHAPVTDGYAAQLADQIDAMRDPLSEVDMPMSNSYNATKAEAARSAKKTIGVMATHNVLHAQLEQALASSNDSIDYKENFVTILPTRNTPADYMEEMDSVKLGKREIHDKTFLLKYTVNKKEYTPKAGNRSDQFSRLLNHAVDNENNGLLNKLGINQDTWPIWTGLTHMGYNQETIAIFTAMPGIQRYLDLKERSRRLGDSSSVTVADVMQEYESSNGGKPLNKEDMLAIVQGTSELSEAQQNNMNYLALQELQRLEALSADLQSVQHFMKFDTKRPKTLIDLQVELAEMQLVVGQESPGKLIDVKQVLGTVKNSVSGLITSHVRETYESLFNVDNNLIRQDAITDLVKAIKQSGYTGNVGERVNLLVKGAKSQQYAWFVKGVTGQTAEEIREKAHDVKTGGIAQELINMRKSKPEIANNAFIKQLVAINAPGQYPHIEFPGDRQLEANPRELQRAFISLLRSSDPEVKAFGEYLVAYALATSTGRLKSRGYMKYVPAEYLQSKNLGDVVTARAISNRLDNRKGLQEVIRHNPELAPKHFTQDPAYQDNFIRKDKQLIMFTSANNFMGSVTINGVLYLPKTTRPIEIEHQGENKKAYILERATPLGDYLSDRYSSEQLPLDAQPYQKKAKGNSIINDLGAPPNMYDEAPGVTTREDYDVPNAVTPVPTTPTAQGRNEFDVDGPPGNMTLGNPKQNVNKKVFSQQAGSAQLEKGTPLSRFISTTSLGNIPFVRMLVDAQDMLPEGNRLKVEVRENMNARGAYNPNTHTLIIRKDSINDTRVVLHELVHAYTQLGIEIANGKLAYPNGLNKQRIEAAVSVINNLYTYATMEAGLKEMGLKWSEYQQARRGMRAFELQQQGTQLNEEQRQDLEFLKQNLDKYYGLMNVKEFIAEAFSNKEFAARLSKMAVDGKRKRNTSWLDKLFEAVTDLLEAMGVSVTSSTALSEVYTYAMDLMDVQTQGAVSELTKQDRLSTSMLLEGMNEPDIDVYNYQGIDELRLYKEKRVRQFEELKSRYKDNREFVRRVEARLVQERKELDRLVDDSVQITPDYFLAVGQRELDFARRTIESVDPTAPQIDMALSALENIYTVVEFYDRSREILKDPLLKEIATELRREASELRDNYLEKARVILREEATNEGINVNADTFEELQSVGWISSRFMDASRQGRAELNFLDKIVRDAAQKQRTAFNTRAKRYMDVSKKFKETNYFKEHSWNGMVELDADGNPTPNIITMLSGAYTAEVSRKRAELGNTKAFFDWKNSVTERMDINALFDYSGTSVVRKNNPKYVQYLENKFGKAGATEFIRQQEALLESFIDHRISEFDTFDLTLEAEGAAAAKELWLSKFDPANAYLRSQGKMKGIKGGTSQYLKDMPLRTIKGKATGYYDARFDQLQSEPAALEFYNDYRQQMKEMMAMLPAHKMTRDAHLAQVGLFIPAIAKSLTNDLFTPGGFLDAVGRIPDSLRGALTIDPQYDVNKLIDPVTGKPRQELPTYFMGQIDPNEQDYDLDRTFLAFAMMATTYDSKNAIEDKVRMTKTVMSNASVKSERTFTDRVLDKLGIEQAPGYRDQASLESTMKVVDTVVDTFYGYQSTVDPTAPAPEMLWSKEVKEEVAALQEQLEFAETEEDKARIQKLIDSKIPQMSAGKTIRGLQQFVQAKGMAWNIPAAIVNMIFGSISVFKHATGRADFNEEHTRKASMLMLNSSLNNMTESVGKRATGTALKIQNAMILFDVLKDFTEMRYDVRKFVKQAGESGINQANRLGFNKLRMYEIQRSSEYFVYGQATLSVLLATEIDGKNLWELMGEDGVIDIDGYRPGEEKHTALMNKIDQINKRIHGNYDPNSPIAIKKTLLGPLLMQFRSWLPEAVASRFETEKYDPYLDRQVKGTYITMFSNEWRRNFKSMMPLLLPAWVRTKNMDTLSEEISAVDQENIRKFAASLRQYMQVAIMIALLRALKDDEDDEDSLRLLNFGLNVADRVENDLSLFGSPGAFLEMTQGDFLAVIGTAADAEKFMEATVQSVQGDPTIETGVYAGKSRMWHHGSKLIPHLGAVQRLANNLDREMNT